MLRTSFTQPFLTLFYLIMTISGFSIAHPYKTPSASLSFVENKGQVTDQHYQSRKDIDFRLNGNGVNVFVANSALHYQWAKPVGTKVSGEDTLQRLATYRMDVKLLGANPDAVLIKEQKQGFYERYYTPQFGEKGGIANAYSKITYKEIYPNIDWVLYVKNNTVEYDFIIHPGGNIADIQLRYDGAVSLKVNTDGSLTATTPMGSITEAAPVSFQQADGKRIASSFALNNNILRFKTSEYKGTLVIDPTLTWATYYGGTGDENTKSGCVTGDQYGNGYLCGYTLSTNNIATSGSFKDTISGSTDAFIVKFNNSGSRLWATFYGGTGADQGWATSCDINGNIYLVGYASSVSTGLATTGSHQPLGGGNQDAFLVKFDSAGTRLWATYYGGSAAEQGYAVTSDLTGNVYMAGYTNNSASAIATSGAHQVSGGGGNDAFLVKFNSAGVRQWGTYYGGNATDQAFTLTCDNGKNVFMAGYTNNSTSGIASTGSHQTTGGGGQDGFLVKFDSTGIRQWGTYYGGTGIDRCLGICSDPNGNSYITGYTTSTANIATSTGHQTTFGGSTSVSDCFLAKFNGSGILQWGTYYGNTGDDWGTAICSDQSNNIFIAGITNSNTSIATVGGIKDTLDVRDAFLVKFDTSGLRQWGTYFGGTDADELGYGIFYNNFSQIYLGGMTTSYTNLATTGSHQSIMGGSTFDGFLALISDCSIVTPTIVSGSDTVCRGASYTYSVPAIAGTSSYTWVLPSGWTGSSTTDTIFVVAGTITDTIKVVANYPCGSSDTFYKVIVVEPLPLITPSGTVSLCFGDTVSLTATSGAAYQWLQSGTAISGANSQYHSVTTAGYYSVVVTSTYGCSDTSLTDTVIVHPLPTPVITVSGTVLSTGTFASYQWNHNGTPIVGAVGSSYSISILSGLYTVTVTDDNGCEGTSNPYDAGTSSVSGIDRQTSIYIYPNPATDVLHIQSPKPVDGYVVGIDGRNVGSFKKAVTIDLKNYAEGIYLIRFYTDEKLIGTQKFVKQSNHK